MKLDNFEHLVSAWHAGCSVSGQAILEPLRPSLRKFFACKVRHREDVDDLVQQTFFICHQSLANYRFEGEFKAFLFGIARHTLLKFYRKQQANRAVPLLDDASCASLGPDPDFVLMQREEVRLLMKAMRRIPLDYQIALELFHWEHMKGAEIAHVLQIPPATVRSRLHRGIKRLREKVAELADSEELLRKTSVNFDSWRLNLHNQLPTNLLPGNPHA